MIVAEITAPAVLPVTVAQVRDDLRLVAAGVPASHPDDALIEDLIRAAVDMIDGHAGLLGRALINRTVQVRWPRFVGRLLLPVPPTQSVTSLTYLDSDHQEQTVAPANYDAISLHPAPGVAQIQPALGKSWPSGVASDRPDAVRATIVAGYGATAEAIPHSIRRAIRIAAAHWYETRELAGALPAAAQLLLAPHRVIQF